MRINRSFKQAEVLTDKNVRFYLPEDRIFWRDVSTYIPGFYLLYEDKSEKIKGPISMWKPFQHYKRWVEIHQEEAKCIWSQQRSSEGNLVTYVGKFPFPYACYWSEERTAFGEPGRLDKGLPAMYVEGTGDEIIPPPVNLDELKTMSLRAMSPSIKSELSIVNSIIELKDFRSVPLFIKKVKDLANRMTHWKPNKLLHGKTASKTLLHDLALTADDAFLQEQFNISPLISDIAGIYRALSKLERRVRALISSSGRTTTKHFMWRSGEVDSVEPSEELWLAKSINFPNTVRYWDGDRYWITLSSTRSTRTVRTSPLEFRAHMQYVCDYTAFQAEHARLITFLDSLGINFNPAIIWNAIPWSFVIDWVVGVSRWLDHLKVGFADPKVSILQYCWSVRQERHIRLDSEITTYVEQPLEPYWRGNIRRPTVHEVAYRRDVGIPDASLFTTSGISSHEAILGGALAFTKTKRHRKWASWKVPVFPKIPKTV